MKNLTVATWNIKNSYLLTDRNEYKLDAIIELLNGTDINIFGLQEVNPILASKIDKKLKKTDSNYQITSSYKQNPIKNVCVEHNLIISNLPSLKGSKIELPSFPTEVDKFSDLLSIRDRNVTYQDFILGKKTLRFYNTHLEFRDETLNMEQFDAIYDNLVRSYLFEKNENILVGNLNIEPNSYNMDYFRTMLANVGLQVVENKKDTYVDKNGNKIVDYILVPDSYTVDSISCIDGYDQKISTHNPVIAKIKK